jgi:hypothetical protein
MPDDQADNQSVAGVYMFHWWWLMTPTNATAPVTLKVTVQPAGPAGRGGRS